VAIAALLLALANPLARALLGGRHARGAVAPVEVAAALRILAAALPFAALLDTVLAASRGYRDMRPTVAVDRVGRSCLQLLGVLAAALTGTATLLAPFWALPYIPAAAVGWIWLRRIHLEQRKALHAEGPDDRRLANSSPRGFWRFSAPRAVATVAQLVIQRLDIVLIGVIRGPVEAAIYTAATRFLVVGQLGNAAISMATQPQLSRLFALRDRRGANQVYQATTAWLIILPWPVYLLAIVYGPGLLAIFGHSYRAGATVMIILGLAMLVSTACGQVDIVLTTTGRSGWSLANGLLACLVNVVVDLALIPRYGITGAAIGWAAAITAANLVPLVQVAWVVRVHPFGTGVLAAGALSALSFFVIPMLMRAVLGGAAATVLALAAGCAVLAAGLWRWRDTLQLTAFGGTRHP
jgi:O-antigen/teichoic acid export membrane protein